ncbi:hypothetical protein FACS1894195_0680 [Bacteroidia bacterium]|nr:hypothetical protein FACS1894195_0680 [Bacteroidia bacterium]
MNKNYLSVALMGTVITAAVALDGCKKDEDGVDLNNPKTLEQISPRVSDGLYGNVKSIITTDYNLSADGAYTLDADTANFTVDPTKAKKSYESTTEYNQAGYITLEGYAQYNSDGTTKNYENKTVTTLDSKNRPLTRVQTNTSDGRTSTTTSTCVYDDANKTATVTVKDGDGTELSQTVYDLDENGNVDTGNSVSYRPTAFESTPYRVVKTVTVKDEHGNVTEVRTISKSSGGYVSPSYSKTAYTYY